MRCEAGTTRSWKTCLRNDGGQLRAHVYTISPAGMSGRNPYATNNEYSNSNASGRYGDLYAHDNDLTRNSVNGHGSRERHPRGYGGLGSDPNEESPQPTSHTRPVVADDAAYRRRPARNDRDEEHSDSSRSRDRGAPRLNGLPTSTGYANRKGQRSMEGQLSPR